MNSPTPSGEARLAAGKIAMPTCGGLSTRKHTRARACALTHTHTHITLAHQQRHHGLRLLVVIELTRRTLSIPSCNIPRSRHAVVP
eukprot:2618736-Prymnesium_polylepis.2